MKTNLRRMVESNSVLLPKLFSVYLPKTAEVLVIPRASARMCNPHGHVPLSPLKRSVPLSAALKGKSGRKLWIGNPTRSVPGPLSENTPSFCPNITITLF